MKMETLYYNFQLLMENLYLSLRNMECGTILLQIEIIELVIEYGNYSGKIGYLSLIFNFK